MQRLSCKFCLVVIFLQTRYLVVLIIRIVQWQVTPMCAFLVSKFLVLALLILIIECWLNELSIIIVALFLDYFLRFIMEVRFVSWFIEGFIMIWVLALTLTRKNHRPHHLLVLIILLSKVVLLLIGMTLSFLEVLN